MSKSGFQMISHSFFEDWQWKGDAYVTCLYLWLLNGAEEEERYVRGVELKRGQLLTSIDKICLKTRLSSKSVRNSLRKLKESGEIEEEVKTNKYRVITIVNYDENTVCSSEIDSTFEYLENPITAQTAKKIFKD